jgi:hypothetical protein
MNRILPLVILVAACKGDGRTQPSMDQSPAKAPLAPALEHATQADLAHDIADAERLGTWREVQQRWQGQTLRWTVTRQRALCSSADDCNVAAFPIQRPAKQGWMPQLSFAAGQYDALARACGSQDQCEVTIEGTLSKLDVSPELPTALELSNVRVVAAPAAQVKTAHS